MMAVTDAGQPFTTRELYQDALDAAEELWETLVEVAAEAALAERLTDWPPNEPERWG